MRLSANRPQTIECADARDYILDALEDGKRPGVLRSHMRHCPECKSLWKGLLADQRELKALAPAGPLAIYFQMLLRGGGPGSGGPWGGGGGGGMRRLTPMFGGGLAVLALLLGVLSGSSPDGSPTSDEPPVVVLSGLTAGEASAPVANAEHPKKKSDNHGDAVKTVASAVLTQGTTWVTNSTPRTNSQEHASADNGERVTSTGTSKQNSTNKNSSSAPSNPTTSSDQGKVENTSEQPVTSGGDQTTSNGTDAGGDTVSTPVTTTETTPTQPTLTTYTVPSPGDGTLTNGTHHHSGPHTIAG